MLHRIDHTNIVVDDLESMTKFYSEVLGLKPIKHASIDGPWVDQLVGLTSVAADVVYLEAPDGSRIELIRFRQPQAGRPPQLERPNTPGLRHVAFRVDNIERMAAGLKSHGVTLLSDVQKVPDAQVTYEGGARKRLVYFHDPEGNLLELCEYQ